MVLELKNMYVEGMHIRLKSGRVILTRSVLVHIDPDFKMKILLMNLSGQANEHGCDKCHFCGTPIQYSQTRGHAMKFPCTCKEKLANPRTHNDYLLHASLAKTLREESKAKLKERGRTEQQLRENASLNSINVMGVKDETVFSLLPYVDLAKLCGTQPMHCIFEK